MMQLRKGQVMSEEQKIKLSIAGKKRFENQEERDKISKGNKGNVAWNKNKKWSKEIKEKLSNSHKGKETWNKGKTNCYSEETCEKMSKSQKKRWENYDEETRIQNVKRFINAPLTKTQDTKIELEVERQLVNLGLKYIKQKYIHDGKRGYFLDFYLPKYKLVIECNGMYWHNRKKAKLRDKQLESYVTSKNRKIIFLWEDEILTNKNIVYDLISGD